MRESNVTNAGIVGHGEREAEYTSVNLTLAVMRRALETRVVESHHSSSRQNS
jgi:hypothetical protein